MSKAPAKSTFKNPLVHKALAKAGSIEALVADTGIHMSTLYRWKRGEREISPMGERLLLAYLK